MFNFGTEKFEFKVFKERRMIARKPFLKYTFLTIIRGRIVYELIVNEGAARVDYLFGDNKAELSNCFSINQVVRQNFVSK